MLSPADGLQVSADFGTSHAQSAHSIQVVREMKRQVKDILLQTRQLGLLLLVCFVARGFDFAESLQGCLRYLEPMSVKDRAIDKDVLSA